MITRVSLCEGFLITFIAADLGAMYGVPKTGSQLPASMIILTMLHVMIGIIDVILDFLFFLAYRQPGYVVSLIDVPR